MQPLRVPHPSGESSAFTAETGGEIRRSTSAGGSMSKAHPDRALGGALQSPWPIAADIEEWGLTCPPALLLGAQVTWSGRSPDSLQPGRVCTQRHAEAAAEPDAAVHRGQPAPARVPPAVPGPRVVPLPHPGGDQRGDLPRRGRRGARAAWGAGTLTCGCFRRSGGSLVLSL